MFFFFVRQLITHSKFTRTRTLFQALSVCCTRTASHTCITHRMHAQCVRWHAYVLYTLHVTYLSCSQHARTPARKHTHGITHTHHASHARTVRQVSRTRTRYAARHVHELLTTRARARAHAQHHTHVPRIACTRARTHCTSHQGWIYWGMLPPPLAICG